MDFGRKRPNSGAVHVNGGTKRFKHESESFATGIGSKSKPCMKFFSTTGCSFGESCHFLHYVPGGFNAAAQMTNNMPSFHPPPRNMGPPPPSVTNYPPPASIKTKLCNRHNSTEGCKFGDKCRFAHGESELGRPTVTPPMPPHQNHNGNFAAAANYGASATAKIAINAALAGPIIGKGGCNSKQICRLTGVKLSIREVESDPSQKNIELEGSFDQIQEASAMVHEIIMGLGPINTPSHHAPAVKPNVGNTGRNAKTKVCEHFLRGSCNYGEKCNFAHGESELRNSQLG